MALVRFNVHVLDYEPGDEVDLPQGWVDSLPKEYITKITKAQADPDALEPAPEAKPEVTSIKKK